LSFSIRNHNTARYLFIILIFSGLLSTGWFGIPLAPRYFLNSATDIVAGLFTLFSALGTIWGIMAYREFTRSIETVIEARMAARKLDPMIGEYEYRSYNPITKNYDEGFVPSGPIDFWDKETQVPGWMDKGKYWHVFLSLDARDKDVKLHVVKDADLPFKIGPRNVAVTTKERLASQEKRTRRHQYTVKIPQWLVMNTERKRFADHQQVGDEELSALISDLNRKIVDASDEVADWERLRIRHHMKIANLGLYLNKSLPLRIVYRQVIQNFPGAKKRAIDETNANLANVKDDQLIASVLELAAAKGISANRMEMLELLILFLKNAYTKLGLGEGASEYHSFHHSLEVSYMALHMLPREIDDFAFGPKEVEIVLVAGLLHDYDPGQATNASDKTLQKGPSVVRTIDEVERSRIIDAYFTMNRTEFANYFREYKSAFSPATEFATTHPEYVKIEWSPIDSAMVEALIWRTDFPFPKQKLAQDMFAKLLAQLTSRGMDADKVSLMAETLWLADLAVTYMGSDPVRAWDRVTNLYDELNLPKLEAVPRTDAFFGDFAENTLFNRLIGTKYFPFIFRQRWKLIYDFFHEGNPSTQLNRTIATARKIYSAVNLEIGMRRGDLLRTMAVENWSEYFIGIGRDQGEVFRAKSGFAELDPQNASAFWGDTERLLPSIIDRTIDNFLLVLPEHSAPSTPEGWASFRAMLSILGRKLVRGGTLRILTDIEPETPPFNELIQIADQSNFERTGKGRSYFPDSWHDPEFKKGSKPHVIALALK
jgi:tRNA G46 methylase TrmB